MLSQTFPRARIFLPPKIEELERGYVAITDGATSRIIGCAISAVTIGPIIGWAAALGWWLAIAVTELAIARYLKVSVALPVTAVQSRWLEATLAFQGFAVNALYSIGFVTAWLRGGELGMFIGGGWIVLSLFYDIVYMSVLRRVFVAMITPTMVCAIVVPLVKSGLSISTLSMFAMLSITLLLALSAVADRRRMQQAIIAAESARLAAEATYASKVRFLATMSHELRTPLNAMIGYAEVIQEDADAETRDETAADAKRIIRAGRHLLGAIDQVMLIADSEISGGSITKSAVSMPSMLQALVESYREETTCVGPPLLVLCDSEMPSICTDGDKLRDCIVQLVDNAFKFGGGTPVLVVASLSGVESATLTLKVTDEGVGIPAEELTRIFEPFTQVDGSETRAFDGMGLGLAVVAHLISLLGGRVEAESVVGHGSIFKIILPVERTDTQAADEVGLAASSRGLTATTP
ncbi:MAG: multi-sensor hybrid histidine kinase [Caulobacteraceae bacterium]|nr:MAG: multi-sensor hybrid histidine kinase [Caulobacteraceae bacterium]